VGAGVGVGVGEGVGEGVRVGVGEGVGFGEGVGAFITPPCTTAAGTECAYTGEGVGETTAPPAAIAGMNSAAAASAPLIIRIRFTSLLLSGRTEVYARKGQVYSGAAALENNSEMYYSFSGEMQ